jgi:hypothetical protein
MKKARDGKDGKTVREGKDGRTGRGEKRRENREGMGETDICRSRGFVSSKFEDQKCKHEKLLTPGRQEREGAN